MREEDVRLVGEHFKKQNVGHGSSRKNGWNRMIGSGKLPWTYMTEVCSFFFFLKHRSYNEE